MRCVVLLLDDCVVHCVIKKVRTQKGTMEKGLSSFCPGDVGLSEQKLYLSNVGESV